MTKNINKILLTTALAFGSLSIAMADVSPSKSASYYGKVEAGGTVYTKLSDQTFKFTNSKVDKGYAIGAEAGYRFDNNLRLGLNFGYQQNKSPSRTQAEVTGTNPVPKLDFKMGKIKSGSAILNIYYDFKELTPNLTPYLTIGLGAARNKVSKSSVMYDEKDEGTIIGGLVMPSMSTQGKSSVNYKSNSKSNFAWNAGFGGLYKIDTNLHLDVSYKYKDLGKVSTSVVDDLNRQAANELKLAKNYTSKLRSHNVMLGVIYSF